MPARQMHTMPSLYLSLTLFCHVVHNCSWCYSFSSARWTLNQTNGLLENTFNCQDLNTHNTIPKENIRSTITHACLNYFNTNKAIALQQLCASNPSSNYIITPSGPNYMTFNILQSPRNNFNHFLCNNKQVKYYRRFVNHFFMNNQYT